MKIYMGIWLDRRNAYIVTIRKDEYKALESFEKITSNVEKKVRLSGGSRTGGTPYDPQEVAVEKKMEAHIKHQLHLYFQDIISKIRNVDQLILLGPGETKNQLQTELKKDHILFAKLKASFTVDKMTERQIAAFVRNAFLEKVKMTGT